MRRRNLVGGLLAGSLALAGVAGTAVAGGPTSSYYFYHCTGPGPDSFWAVKTATPPVSGGQVSAASAFRVDDSTDLFTVYDFDVSVPPGIDRNGVATTYCSIDISGFGTLRWGGRYSPS